MSDLYGGRPPKMTAELKKWINSNIKEKSGVPIIEVYNLMHLNKTSVVGGKTLEYDAKINGNEIIIYIYDVKNNRGISAKGVRDKTAPWGYGWFKPLYEAACELLSSGNGQN